MKKYLYKSAYRVVSWLTDLSGGKSLLLKWKTALAVMVIGLSATATTGCKPTCYAPPMCYDPAVEEVAPQDNDAPGEDHPSSADTFTGSDSDLH